MELTRHKAEKKTSLFIRMKQCSGNNLNQCFPCKVATPKINKTCQPQSRGSAQHLHRCYPAGSAGAGWAGWQLRAGLPAWTCPLPHWRCSGAWARLFLRKGRSWGTGTPGGIGIRINKSMSPGHTSPISYRNKWFSLYFSTGKGNE